MSAGDYLKKLIFQEVYEILFLEIVFVANWVWKYHICSNECLVCSFDFGCLSESRGRSSHEKDAHWTFLNIHPVNKQERKINALKQKL